MRPTWKQSAKTRIQQIVNDFHDSQALEDHQELSPNQLKRLKRIVSQAYASFNPWTAERSGSIYKAWLDATKEMGLDRNGTGPGGHRKTIPTDKNIKEWWLNPPKEQLEIPNFFEVEDVE